jgi:putative ABC transport system ATP-binding protein
MPDTASFPDYDPRQAVIVVENVTRVYASGEGAVHALRSVSLTVREGEFVAIVGTSGSGKSTLMNILGCLDRPTEGTYHLAGTEVGSRSAVARALARNRLIGFVFQGYNLLPRLTALENTELPLQYRSVSRAERRRRATEALESVGLGQRLHHRPNQLSGGQQQRVAIARALVTNPPLLLADEPTGNLDTRTTYEVLAMLQALNRTRGLTIVLVTHEPEVAACARRVVTVRDGLIRSDVQNARQTDAAEQLARLPPPDVDAPAAARVEKTSRIAAFEWRAHVSQFLGIAIGAAVGYAYARWVLEDHVVAVALCGSLLGEAALACRYASRRGRPFDDRERWRLAFASTAATCAAALAALWGAPDLLEGLGALPRHVGLAVALPGGYSAFLLLLAALVGARYALLIALSHTNPHRLRVVLGGALALSVLLLGSSAVFAAKKARAAAAAAAAAPHVPAEGK